MKQPIILVKHVSSGGKHASKFKAKFHFLEKNSTHANKFQLIGNKP
jgi:hypothetical protein